MEMRQLAALVGVVRHGGFSSAARSLSTTQSTLSKTIGQLEHECGLQLLERFSRGVRLTDAGEKVYRRALSMLAEREHLRSELADLNGLAQGRLRLGLPALGSSVLFAPLVADYRRQFPAVEIDLYEYGSKQQEEALRCGEIEVGATLRPKSPDLAWQLLVDEPLVALMPEGHPLAGSPSIRFKDLATSPFILFERGFSLNSVIEQACRRRGTKLNVAARGSQADFVIALVTAGLGVAVLPRLEVSARGRIPVSTASMDDADLRWKLGLLWRKGTKLSPAAERWRQLVKARH